ncbi:MAG: alpha/beta hydrolase, partial [Polyangiaceae bacterium]
PYLGEDAVELTFAQRLRLKATALRAAAVNRAVHTVARVRYAMPDAHPEKHGVAILRNIVYGPTTTTAHRLDVYVPLHESKPRPVVMYVHGGGFSMLSKDTHRVMAMAFARRGYLVFNINYRLGQKNPFPAPLEDAAEALIWVQRHAAEYGGDPQRIILAGESAGGNLVAALALACAAPLETSFLKRLYDANISPVATVSTYPFADLTSVNRVLNHPRVPFWAKHMTFDAAASYAGHHVYDLSQVSRLASPLLVLEEMLKNAPILQRPLSPFFLAVGTKDPLIEDSRRMKRALDGLGVTCELHISPGEVHGFDAMVWRPAARDKWNAVHEFLARTLAAPHVEGEEPT